MIVFAVQIQSTQCRNDPDYVSSPTSIDHVTIEDPECIVGSARNISNLCRLAVRTLSDKRARQSLWSCAKFQRQWGQVRVKDRSLAVGLASKLFYRHMAHAALLTVPERGTYVATRSIPHARDVPPLDDIVMAIQNLLLSRRQNLCPW